MANVKITALTNLASPATEDVFVIDDVDAVETKKITLANVVEAINTQTDNAALVRGNVDSFAAHSNSNAAALAAAIGAAGTDFSPQINLVQDNVVAAEANVVLNTQNLDSFASTSNSNASALAAGIVTAAKTLFIADSGGQFDVNRTNNEKLDLEGGTGISTTADSGAKKITIGLDTVGGSHGKFGGVDGTTVQIPQLVFDNFGRQLSGTNNAVEIDFATIEGNVNTVSANVDARNTQLNANIDLVQDNVEARNTQLNANIDVVQDNVEARNTQLNANLDAVQDNVAAILDGTDNFTGEVTMNDDLIVTGNLTVNGTTTTISTTNMDVEDTLIMLANGTTGSPSNDVGILFNRGSEGNAAFYYDESSVTFKLSDTLDPSTNTQLSAVTASNLDVGILTAATVKFDGTDLNTAITDNVALLDTQSNAHDTYTQLNANIDVVSSNTDAVEARRVANIAGAISTVTTADLTIDRVLVSDSSGKIAVSDGQVTTTELGYLNGVTSAIQPQISTIEGDTNRHFSNYISYVAYANNRANTLSDNVVAAEANVVLNTQNLDSFASTTNTTLGSISSNLTANLIQIEANINSVSSNSDGVEARRVANIAGAISSVLTTDLTASRVVASDASGKITSSTVTTTELDQLSGLTASATELNYLQVTELGLVEASKTLTANTDGEVTFPDDKKLYFGSDQDYSIDFDTTNSGVFHRMGATGQFRVNTNQFQVYNANETHVLFRADAGSITNLYYNGDLRFQVQSTNVSIQNSDLEVENNVYFGTNSSNIVTSTGRVSAPSFSVDGADLTTMITDNVALLDTRANAFATFTKLDANINVVQDNVTANFNQLDANINVVQDNVTANFNQLDANINVVQDNVEIRHTQLNSNINVVQDNVAANFTQLDSNINVVQDNVTANFNQLDANISVVQNNVTANFNQLDANINVVQDNVTANFNQLDANINVVSSNSAAVEARRVANIAGAISTVLTSDLAVDRALISDSSGKIAVSTITSAELGFLDGLDQNLNANLAALAAGIVGAAAGTFPTGDYGLLDAANAATDAFGETTSDLDLFDMKSDPTGDLATEDLGALS